MSLAQNPNVLAQHQPGLQVGDRTKDLRENRSHRQQILTPAQRLASANEETWLQIGKLAELMNDLDRAMIAYESALRQNPYSVPAMNQIATILRAREQFPRAVEYFQSILNLDQNNGETWGSLGHCYLMMDDLQKAYSAYQQALYHLQNPKEPKLWYGIGILYDRYGSLEHAEEAFSQVMRMDPTFEKANEIYFRLGIIYKQQHKYSQSLECFRYIITNPPKPLTEADIWFQIGHVYEQQKEYGKAKEAYERVLRENPDHAKVLQQLGWLYHQQSSAFADQDLAVQFLTKSLESDGADAQSWYLLGRCYMAQRKYNKAYEAYQQAVYRDGRNPTFWCSIGVLYYQINQYRDALDAYSRAIRLNPYISEVWYDLGTLYESCNNQVSDALDAYSRAAELDPSNMHIKSRLDLLRSGQSGANRNTATSAPHPQDINPSAYQNSSQAAPSQWSSSASHIANPPRPSQPGSNASYRNDQAPENQLSSINGKRESFSKPDGPPPPMPPFSQHNNNYLPSQNPTTQNAPMPPSENNLAPMLGRTSPAPEVKPIDEPRPSPPTEKPANPPSPTESNTLKRPRDGEEPKDAPEPKRMEQSFDDKPDNAQTEQPEAPPKPDLPEPSAPEVTPSKVDEEVSQAAADKPDKPADEPVERKLELDEDYDEE